MIGRLTETTTFVVLVLIQIKIFLSYIIILGHIFKLLRSFLDKDQKQGLMFSKEHRSWLLTER